MPAISKIRFTNVIYEDGGKRYNDDTFQFDGHNGTILLENGGGKTVFVQTALQAILPHQDLGDRKIKDTLSLEGSPCHIAIEWILNEKPRKYLVTAVTLFLTSNALDSYRYTYEYGEGDNNSIDELPFSKENNGKRMATGKAEINEYYSQMKSRSMNAKTFNTIGEYHEYIEENYKIIPSEWRSIARINGDEGGVEGYFKNCNTTSSLVDKLLIPVVEEAISENGTDDFVNTFEEQRERFKKHKQLREIIEESKEIEKKINEYVNIFLDYHNINETFKEKQSYTKSIYRYIEKEKLDIENNILEIEEDIEKTKNLYEKLKEKELSYELAILKEELNEYELKLNEVRELFNETKDDYDDKSAKFNNLKIAKIKKEIKESEDNIKKYKEQIEILESDIDIEDIKLKLKENSCKLRWYFLSEENNLRDNLSNLKEKESMNKEESKKVKKDLKELQIKSTDILKNINERKGQRNQIEKDMVGISKKIIDLSLDEDIIEKQKIWIEKVSEVESLIIENEKTIKKIDNERNIINIKLNEDRDNAENIQNRLTIVKENRNKINDEDSKLTIKVKELSGSWGYINSIYTKERSIISYMENKVENLINEKENLLLEERLSGRFKDDYDNLKYFTPEPLLEEWIKSWKNQFKYIETGTQYIQRASKTLGKKEEEIVNEYPYWSISIVVEDGKIKFLKDELYKNIDKITFPILVLGQDEATNIIREGKNKEELLILPKHWKDNVNQELFEKWKVEISKKVEEITQRRKDKEEEINNYDKALNDVKTFLNQYPYEVYSKLKEEESSIEEDLSSLKKSIKNKEDRLSTINSEISRVNKQNKEKIDESNNLNKWIDLAQDYIVKNREKERIETLLYDLNDKFKKLDIEINSLNRELERKNNALDSLKVNIRDFNNILKNLINDELYKEVKEEMPKETNESKITLKEDRKILKDILNERQGSIVQFYELIKITGDNKEKLITNLDIERRQSDYKIDGEVIFPFYGQDEMEKLLEEIGKLKPIKKDRENKFKKIQSNYDEYSNKYKFNEEEYYKKYNSIIKFEEPLYKIKDSIEIEKKELNIRIEKNKEVYERLLKVKDEVNGLITLLDIKDGEYKYLVDYIETIHLDESFCTEFPYDRAKFIKKALDDLENIKNDLVSSKNRLDSQKNVFSHFCNDNIRDARLKERTIAGIRQKIDYEEILNWQHRMKKSIETTIKIAEGDIREHDKDLERFINHIVKYIRNLTDELNEIPKKTRIKVEDKWKEIYQFNIPEWKEEEGKEEIRKHIDWMIKELDSTKFKNEDNTDVKTCIRKEIEKWLDSKQLLMIVLKNNSIKIRCRKVTNDGNISSGFNTWESSNRWSGGEKWSKNMTLFLGILNYLAEKRQSIITGLKANRTVIMDNPFGKASSDHVLDPVFFIAGKLGFQIITLTAHAEGSFIRNYFPVVYSCRLRESTNNETLIIDKEKEIQYAFFKDKEPQVLNKLEDKEQLDLFS